MARKRKNARSQSPRQRGPTLPPQESRALAHEPAAERSIAGIDAPRKHRTFLIVSALGLVLWLSFLVAMAMRG